MSAGNLILFLANNDVADQPVHLPSLISDFANRYLEMIVDKLATCKYKMIWQLSVAEQAEFSHNR